MREILPITLLPRHGADAFMAIVATFYTVGSLQVQGGIMGLFNELARRNVFKVAGAYVIVSWLMMQVAEVMAPALRLPQWAISFVAFVLILGFPVAMVSAWAFELTPEGLRKEKDVDRAEAVGQATGQKLNRLILVLLVFAVAYIAWDKLPGAGGEGVKVAEPARPALSGDETGATTTEAMSKSIAVLPFQNRSANEENAAFFADGVHDELLTNLSRIADLKVISRTSVMGYRDSGKNMRQIGAELGVATLLEGAVQRAENRLRVNAQLINADTDEHLWAETYDRELTAENIFAIQSEIALAIVGALEATLLPATEAALQRVPTGNLQAYDLYLRATQLQDRGNWADLEQALAHLEQATTLDPGFQPAWVLKARTLIYLHRTGARTFDAVRGLIENSLEQALALDPDSGAAHGARAAYIGQLGDAGAMDEFERALQLDPNNVQILDDYAQVLSVATRPEAAIEFALKARDLNPLSATTWFRLARIYEQLGELDGALEAYSRVRQLDPESSSGYASTAGPYVLRGQIAQSLVWLYQGLERDPADLDLLNWAVRNYITLGDSGRARAQLEILVERNPAFPMTLANLAILDVQEGRVTDAVRHATANLDATLNNRWGSVDTVVTVLLIDAVQREDPTAALNLLRNSSPALFQPSPEVGADNVLIALDTAQLLMLDGQQSEGERLLRAVLDFVDRLYALTGSTNAWRVTAKARALALLGKKDAALEELQRQVDAGWRVLWRWQMLHSPNFNILREDPVFQDLVRQLEADMDRQLRQARVMEQLTHRVGDTRLYSRALTGVTG